MTEAAVSTTLPRARSHGPGVRERETRRVSKSAVAWAVALAAMVGGTGGYVALKTTSHPSPSPQSAYSAPLPGQAEGHLARQETERRAEAAYSARLQGQADVYLAHQETERRAEAAYSARLQGQADVYLAHQEAERRANAAYSARLQGQADAYLGQ